MEPTHVTILRLPNNGSTLNFLIRSVIEDPNPNCIDLLGEWNASIMSLTSESFKQLQVSLNLRIQWIPFHSSKWFSNCPWKSSTDQCWNAFPTSLLPQIVQRSCLSKLTRFHLVIVIRLGRLSIWGCLLQSTQLDKVLSARMTPTALKTTSIACEMEITRPNCSFQWRVLTICWTLMQCQRGPLACI